MLAIHLMIVKSGCLSAIGFVTLDKFLSLLYVWMCARMYICMYVCINIIIILQIA